MVNVETAGSHLSAIIQLAEQIAKAAPECAEKAMLIVELAQEIEIQPDREAIQDAIESQLVDSELSDPQVQTMTSAVVGTLRKG